MWQYVAVCGSMFGVEEADALVTADVGFGGCSACVVLEFRDRKYVSLVFVDEVASGRGHEAIALVPYGGTEDGTFGVWVVFWEVREVEGMLLLFVTVVVF